jgi:ABC-type Fe3+-hydroxamate transport system substrate-binding protein
MAMLALKLWRKLRLFGIGIMLALGLALAACSAATPQQAQPEPASVTSQSESEQEQDSQPVSQSDEPEQQQVQTQQEQQVQQQKQQAVAPAHPQQDEQPQATADQEQQQTPTESQSEQQADAGQAQSSPQSVRPLEGVRGIVDPSNDGWPREVEGLNGVVSIDAKPARIITASIGHDEITLALVPNDRLVAVGDVTKISTYSNVADLVQDKAVITRDPETIIAEEPDVVVTSPFFPADGIDALERAGIAVIQTELVQTPESRINAILLMGYIFGEEERAWAFADEIQSRFDALVSVTGVKETKPRVLALTSYSDTLWVAGANSTEGGVIEAGGGLNAAADAGIEGNQTTSLEGVIAMAPDVIVIAQPIEFGAEEFRQSLFENAALSEVPAIKNGAVYVVESKHFTTLSFWNIRGAEDLARILWPEDFPEPPAQSFSLAE